MQLDAIVGVDHSPHAVQTVDEAIERRQDGHPVLGTDVEPDGRVAAGDAGHVAKAAGGKPQQRGVFLAAVAGQAHQRGGGEVRHVADDRDHLVVALGRQCNHVGTEIGDDGGHRAEGAVGRRSSGGEHPHGAFEHAAVGAVETVELAAGHRVATHEARVVDAAGKGPLHAADIGDQAIRVGQRPLHLVDQREHGGGHEGDLGVGVQPGSGDEAHRQGLRHLGWVVVVAVHRPATIGERAQWNHR